MSIRRHLVGRALRNRLLDLPQGPREWVFTGAESLARALQESGFQPAPEDQPRLARRGRIEQGRLCMETGPEVRIEDELALAPLTIDALAEDESGRLIDPHGGREHLDEGLLRHPSPLFGHDILNLLRVALAGAELRQWGFRLAHGTHGLMKRMAQDHAALEKLRDEIAGEWLDAALQTPRPSEYLRILHRCGALEHLHPELDGLFESDQSHGSGLPEAVVQLDSLPPEQRTQFLEGTGSPVQD